MYYNSKAAHKERQSLLLKISIYENRRLRVFNSRQIQCIIPIYPGMPYHTKSGIKYIIILSIGEVYVLDEHSKMITKIDYFGLFAPHLYKYVQRIIGSSLNSSGELILYLNNNTFITLDLSSLTLIDKESKVTEHPLLRYAFVTH
ncbi:hypothetical protein VCSRO12_1184 [Vibrio cholerae]|nr:hypothetical protein VCSRO12_1184 [Vibrio cholerae]